MFFLVLAALFLQTIRVKFARVWRVDRVLFAYLLTIAVTLVPARTDPDLVTFIPRLIRGHDFSALMELRTCHY